MGYIASMRLELYRSTRDGRRVCARPSLLKWRRRWFYVTPAEEGRFERRFFGVQAASLVAMLTLMERVGDRLFQEPLWLLALFVVVAPPGSGRWITAGLAPAPRDAAMLEPEDRAARNLEMARAAGPVTLWVLLIAGLAMAALQLFVLLTERVWWAWFGLAMFVVASGAMARQLLLLRGARTGSRAS